MLHWFTLFSGQSHLAESSVYITEVFVQIEHAIKVTRIKQLCQLRIGLDKRSRIATCSLP